LRREKIKKREYANAANTANGANCSANERKPGIAIFNC